MCGTEATPTAEAALRLGTVAAYDSRTQGWGVWGVLALFLDETYH
jgi:hypothetical protein